MIYLLLGSKPFLLKKKKEKKLKKEKCDPPLSPSRIAIGLLGHKAQEGKVKFASPHDLSCFDIGAFLLSTKQQEALRRWRTKPWEELDGVGPQRQRHWGLGRCSKKNRVMNYI